MIYVLLPRFKKIKNKKYGRFKPTNVQHITKANGDVARNASVRP